MAYQRDDLLESETAYRISVILWKEVSYGAQIARKLDRNAENKAESVRNLLRVMASAGIICEVKEESLKIMNEDGSVKKDLSKGNRKYYSIDIEGLYEYWFEEIRKKLKHRLIQGGIKEKRLTDKASVNRLIQEERDAAEKLKQEGDLRTHGRAYREIEILEFILWSYDMTPEYGGRLKPFFRKYVPAYLKLSKEGTLERMLFQDISAGLHYSQTISSDEGWQETLDEESEFEILSELLTLLIGNPSGIEAAKTAITGTMNNSNI
jgi:hypothetical protein